MKEKLKEKYVFFDVDGTLSEYRYDDRLYSGGRSEFGCQTLDNLLFGNQFLTARPLKTMQRVIEELNPEKVFILGAITTGHELDQKKEWLKKHYPTIKEEHYFFIHQTMLKPEVILECVNKFHLNLDQVVFVDDRLDVLRKAEEFGICAYHPSSFME